MKWVFTLFLFGLVLISGCTQPDPGNFLGETKPDSEFPSEISHEECQRDPRECLEFCEESPSLCSEGFVPEGHEGFSTDFAGPGGCQGTECKQYCMQNFQECQEWCLENESPICQFFGGHSGTGSQEIEVSDPPETSITFAKSLNFNAGQFSQQDILKAKELGANMVTFWPIREVRNDEFSIFALAELPQMIDFAHKNGLQVELRSSIIFPQTTTNYEKYKTNAIEHAEEYAKLAEKYKVYRIIPFAEVDNDLMNHCGKITEFSQAVLTEMRKHYSGKIGIGVAAPWRDCGFTFNGYDYLSVSAYPHKDLSTSINWAKNIAAKSGITVVHLGETGVSNPGDQKTPDAFQTLELSKEKEADYYNDLFTDFSDKVDGFSIFFNSKTTAMTVNGQLAEEVVKEWYGKL